MPDKCKRPICDAVAESMEYFYGYCSLQCRDSHEDEEEIERLKGELEFAKDEMRRYIRRSQVLEAQVNAWRKALEWYASPVHWVEQVDDRGRETIRWRWADDDGRMARHALDSWKVNKERNNGENQGTETTGGQGGEADADTVASAGNDQA